MSMHTFTSQYNLNMKTVWTTVHKLGMICFVCSYLMENIYFPPHPNIFWFMLIDLLCSITLLQINRMTMNGYFFLT